MKKQLLFILLVSTIMINGTYALANLAGCSDAGVASVTTDSICYEDTTVLQLTAYIGTIQWQSYDGIIWNNETGPGSTTDSYPVFPGASTQYRAVVTDGACPPDTSNLIQIIVGIIPAPSGTGASRCGYGQITLNGTGNGTLRWYDMPSGGIPLGTGNSFTTNVGVTTTFYLEDNTSGGTGGTSPLLITELDIGNNDYLELQNVSNQPVDVTGWKVAINNSYTDINLVNADVQILSGIMQPGDMIVFTDNTAGPNYWGSNMLWNPGAFPTFTGWVIILDDNNNLKDFIALNWPAANIQAMNPLVNGVNILIGTQWAGDGVDITSVVIGSTGVSRAGNTDNQINTDFTVEPLNINLTNPNIVLPFSGFGCSSPRVPVVATVTAADAVNINATQNALCLGDSSILTASSTNPGYNYTWSPSTGLSSTTGAVVTAIPATTITYTVVGDDGTCGAIDSITISVGPTSVAGTATQTSDTICLGTNSTLYLAGSVGSIQWQGNTGTGWVNETGPGSTTDEYEVSPPVSTDYWAIVTSGGCAPDTSIILHVEVLSASDPVTVNDTICGPGIANLQANGPGTMNWFTAPSGGNSIFTGPVYSPSISNTTTYYVEAIAGGGTFNVGPPNNGFGSQTTNAGFNDYGLAFDVVQQVTLDRVYVYPAQTGNITINLRSVLAGPILNTVTVPVTAFVPLTPIDLGWTISPGTGYRLELAAGSVLLYYNSTNAVYPYTVPGSPLSITGYLNPNFNTGALYLFFYNWQITDGCKSNRLPVTGVVLPAPPVPTISQNGLQLTSSSPVNNQWYMNGVLIPGATGQVYNVTVAGTYTVVVTDPSNGCTSESAPVIITSVLEINDISSGIIIYPNPVNDKLLVTFRTSHSSDVLMTVYNSIGEKVFSEAIEGNTIKHEIDFSGFADGIYVVTMRIDNIEYQSMITKM